MGRDEDAKDSNIDGRDDQGGPPFQSVDSPLRLRDDGDTVDNNLHEQLDLKDPEEEDEE